MRTISQRELRNDSSAVLRAVEAGESMTITKSGIPVAELRPVNRRRLVPARELVRRAELRPPVDADLLRQDVDAVVDPSVPDDPLDRHGAAPEGTGERA